MYNRTDYNQNTQILPKICMDGQAATNCITNTESTTKMSTTSSNNYQDNENIRINAANKNIYRPTYGAYLNKSLPRGPYLQYKINDYQSRQLLGYQNDNNDNNRLLLQQKYNSQDNMKNLAATTTTTTATSTTSNKLLSATLPRTKMTIPTTKTSTTTTETKRTSLLDQNLNEHEINSHNIGIENKMPYESAKSNIFCENGNIMTINEGHQQYNYHQNTPYELKDCKEHEIGTNINYFKVNNKFDTINNQYQKYFLKEPEINMKHYHNQNHNTLPRQNDFINKIYEKNPNIFTRMTTTTGGGGMAYNSNINHNFYDRHQNGFYSLPNVSNKINEFNESKRIIASQVDFITLADVIQAKPKGLNEIEGWAILCQAVQALQDMFLADFPTSSKILPLVRTSTLQITSRGRVVFSIITVGQLDKFNDVTSYFNVTDHLSPEYYNGVGKKVVFAESDMEKMWIYSLGLSLRSVINMETENKIPKPTHYIRQNLDEFHNNYSLDDVIECMCKRDIHQRASLMYLLDVISLFCRSQKQMKPFSHIVMEIFQFVTQLPITKEIDCNAIVPGTETTQLSDGVRSETDSGRGSAYGERGDLTPPFTETRKSCLKVKQDKQFEDFIHENCVNNVNYGTDSIGYLKNDRINDRRLNSNFQVFRRNKRDFLRRKKDLRRNTIDISLFDVEKAKEVQYLQNINAVRSMECIDKFMNCEKRNFIMKTDDYQLTNGTSLPDLCPQSTKASASLKVQPNKIHFRGVISEGYSDESFFEKGPEFIVKLNTLPKEVCITDLKCHHQRTLNVLLLNGKTIKITCNSITTTTSQILEAIFQIENYIENFFLGLCAFIGDDFVFLPKDLKIYKVAPQAWINPIKKGLPRTDAPNFILFIRVKFLLPQLRGISSLESRHMLYLQLRKSILEKSISCTEDDLITLGGLALQAEMGDFKESMKYHGEYFTISHYLPEGVYHRNKEMVKYLRNSHFCRRGLHPKEAEQNFIKYVQEMKEYGFHLYSAIWTTDDGNFIDVYVGISLCGIALFERNNKQQISTIKTSSTIQQQQQQQIITSSSLSDASGINSNMTYQRKLYMSFEWLEIENLCYSKHVLCIVVRKSESLKAKDNNRIKYKLKMDGRKSYFAFSLASEHHQFYMKLRNSFISLKNLSTELNIPITSYTFEDKKSTSEIRSSTHHINTIPSTSPLLSSSSPISSSLFNNPATIVPKISTTAIMTKTNDKNTNFEEQQIQPSNHHQPSSSSSSSGITLQENIKKIDKQLKASGLRVKNLKKSMLNDNRLTKLKERLLKRSKSTAGTIIEKVTTTITQNRNSKDEKQSKKNQQQFQQQLQQEQYHHEDNIDDGSKEANQNKENECPIKVFLDGDESPKCVYSPNRNRVKMGTRVFSSQFLNKSFDNIYEQAALNICQFESLNSIDRHSMVDDGGNFDGGDIRYGGKIKDDNRDNKNDGCKDVSGKMKSNEINSLYFDTEKISNSNTYNDSISPLTEAFVIHSSIKSDRDLHCNFTIPNETISESLLEKFTNISCTSNSNTNDRILTKLIVVKERLNHLKNQNNEGKITTEAKTKTPTNVNTDDFLCFNEMKRDTTFNHRMAKEYYYEKNDSSEKVKYYINSYNNSNGSNNKIYPNNINSNNIKKYSSSMGSCLPSTISQESYLIDNKFFRVDDDIERITTNTINGGSIEENQREGVMAINQKNMENDLEGFTLGISIVQGTDNNVYVKDLVKNGPGDKVGIRIGDQIIAVNGISLLNLSYAEALKKLQNTGLVVELIVSQIFNKVSDDDTSKTANSVACCNAKTSIGKINSVRIINSSTPLTNTTKKDKLKPLTRTQSSIVVGCNNIDHNNIITTSPVNSHIQRYSVHDAYLKQIRFATDDVCHITNNNEIKEIQSKRNGVLTPAKSMPDLPKVVAIIPKRVIKNGNNINKQTLPRTMGQSRKYFGPVRYPVTPFKTTILSPHRKHLSLLADSDDDLVYI